MVAAGIACVSARLFSVTQLALTAVSEEGKGVPVAYTTGVAAPAAAAIR